MHKRFYFDYAASTPVHPEVEKVMRPYFLEKFGNAGSLHSFGQEASSAMDSSREAIADAIGAEFREIVFTGSATEANNLAVRGVLRGVKRQGSGVKRPRVIISAIEHESILETARDLEREGIEVVVVPVDRNGIVQLDKLKSALDERTVLVSVMYANNEIGTIQPISEIAKLIRDFRNSKSEILNSKQIPSPKFKIQNVSNLGFSASNLMQQYPLLHVDAVQAFQFLDCDVRKLGVDMLTLSAHKIYGPKGIGALYVRQGSRVRGQELTVMQQPKGIMTHDACSLTPVITGGNQEFGLRSGTENIPLIVGFSKAVELAVANRKSEFRRIGKLKEYFWNGILKIYPRAELNGGLSTNNESSASKSRFYRGLSMPTLSSILDIIGTKSERIRKFETHSKFAGMLPNMLNIYFPDHEAQYLLAKFDLAGIAVSAGSACSARSAKQSYVIIALGFPEKRARQSIRFSFGRPTTQKDIDSALKIIRRLL